jgi:hypothetical protein
MHSSSSIVAHFLEFRACSRKTFPYPKWGLLLDRRLLARKAFLARPLRSEVFGSLAK